MSQRLRRYSALLGIKPAASQSEIRTAYRLVARRAHPDKEGGSEKAFRRVARAYSALCSAQRTRRDASRNSAALPLTSVRCERKGNWRKCTERCSIDQRVRDALEELRTALRCLSLERRRETLLSMSRQVREALLAFMEKATVPMLEDAGVTEPAAASSAQELAPECSVAERSSTQQLARRVTHLARSLARMLKTREKVRLKSKEARARQRLQAAQKAAARRGRKSATSRRVVTRTQQLRPRTCPTTTRERVSGSATSLDCPET